MAQETEINKDLFPELIGYVNDFENILSEEQEMQLTNFLSVYEQNTTNEIAVVTINSIEPYSDFNQYAIDLS
ncbi:MAG: TPM domain-containing protein, partial [Bacteroidota bacterium]